MRFFLIILLLIQFPVTLYAQEDSLVLPKKGIYKYFVNFQQNTPREIRFNAFSEEKEISDKEGTSIFYVYLVKGLDNKKLPEARLAWGFCDKEKIYIRSRHCRMYTYFVPFIYIGRYCYFVDYKGATAGNPGSPGSVGGAGNAATLVEYYMDINTGIVQKLSNSDLINILENEPDLLESYKSDPNRKYNRSQFLKKYNEKHAGDIKKEIVIKGY